MPNEAIPPLYCVEDESRAEERIRARSDVFPFWNFRRDYERLIHSPSFRRLQGKTQLFPSSELDFFRNRLTHSLEVAQIAKAIALRLNSQPSVFPEFTPENQKVCPDIVEFAGLAHDLGHPPFGHIGEYALDECMKDFGGYEGNAQTLRIISKLEKKELGPELGDHGETLTESDRRLGLNLTWRSLASILKYDTRIPSMESGRSSEGVQKGYYFFDADLVKRIKAKVLGKHASDVPFGEFKTLECSIMDIADDIAYSTYDLEDSFKLGVLSPLQLLLRCGDEELTQKVAETVEERIGKYYPNATASDRIFARTDVRDTILKIFSETFLSARDDLSQVAAGDVTAGPNDEIVQKIISGVAFHVGGASYRLAGSGRSRTEFTSERVKRAIENIEIDPRTPIHPAIRRVRLRLEVFKEVEVLKNFTYQVVIMSPDMKVLEYRGKKIIRDIFGALEDRTGNRLLPDDFKKMYEQCETPHDKKRVICDFIAGMTDRYAFEFFDRLNSSASASIHKRLS